MGQDVPPREARGEGRASLPGHPMTVGSRHPSRGRRSRRGTSAAALCRTSRRPCVRDRIQATRAKRWRVAAQAGRSFVQRPVIPRRGRRTGRGCQRPGPSVYPERPGMKEPATPTPANRSSTMLMTWATAKAKRTKKGLVPREEALRELPRGLVRWMRQENATEGDEPGQERVGRDPGGPRREPEPHLRLVGGGRRTTWCMAARDECSRTIHARALRRMASSLSGWVMSVMEAPGRVRGGVSRTPSETTGGPKV